MDGHDDTTITTQSYLVLRHPEPARDEVEYAREETAAAAPVVVAGPRVRVFDLGDDGAVVADDVIRIL